MSMKRKAKKFATFLNLMVSGVVLTSCGKENDSISENQIFSDYEIDNSGIIVYSLPGIYDGQTDVWDSEKKTKMTNDIYKEIKTRVEESEYHCLNLNLKSTLIDFSNIDTSQFTRLIIDCPNIEFNYKAFSNNIDNYEFVKIVINQNTNKNDIKDFLQFIRLENAHLSLSFTEDVSSDLINEYLETVSEIEYLDKFSIETSANINDLELSKIKCNILDVLHNADKELSYDIAIDDSIERLNLQTSYSENYKEDEILLKQLIVNSNRKDLLVYYYVDGIAKVYDDTIIMVPNNSWFEIDNVNIDNISNSWYQQFSNTSKTAIVKLRDSFVTDFYYDSSQETIDDAIDEMNFVLLENEVRAILEENDLEIRRYEETLYLEADKPSDIVIEDYKVYDYINSVIKKYNVTRLVIEKLDKQIDFRKIDLANIISTDLSGVGYNFDYTEFIKLNNEQIPTNNLWIKVKKDSNHTNRINYLKSISLMNNAFIHIDIRGDVDLKTVTSYINALDLSKVSCLDISYDKIDKLDLANLNVPRLCLTYNYTDNPKEIIDCSININDEVKELVLYFYYNDDKDYELNPILNKVEVNTSNNDLTTYLMIGAGVLDESLNCRVNNATNISVPDNSNLYLIGVEEDSINKEFLTQFNNLNRFIVKNNYNDYQYEYLSGEWVYFTNEKNEEKKLLNEM